MKLNRKNAARLASISALGAGAVILGAEDADASVLYNNLGGTPAHVGWGQSGTALAATFVGKLTNGNPTAFTGAKLFSFKRASSIFVAGGTRDVNEFGIPGNVEFVEKNSTALRLFPAGSKLTGTRATHLATNTLVERRLWDADAGTEGTSGGNVTASPEYALFQFNCPTSGTCYGWVELTVEATASSGLTGNGPDVTIDAYAYDPTPGQLLAAGDTSTPVPEPNTLALSGLGALALGAVGVRRWRAARRAQQVA